MPPLNRSLALIAVAALAAAACSNGSGNEAAEGPASTTTTEAIADLASDAAPPADVPDIPGGASGYSHLVFELLGGDVKTTLVEGPRGEQVREPWSYQQLKEMHDSGEQIPEELRMTEDELADLVSQLDEIRAATEKYQDIDVAIADGYRQTTNQVPNMGEHWNRRGAGSRDFDPSDPDILMYITNDDGEKELVGTSFVLSRSRVGDDHPDAFAGQLDNWHVHYELCSGNPDIASRSATRHECQAGGGAFIPSYGWMIHAWVWTDNPLGVFQMWNPSLPPYSDPDTIRADLETELPDGSILSSITNFSFGAVTAGVGEEVTWANSDSVPHTVTSGSRGTPDGAFDSGVFQPGESFSTSFDETGTYTVTCTLHPQMTGVVVVRD